MRQTPRVPHSLKILNHSSHQAVLRLCLHHSSRQTLHYYKKFEEIWNSQKHSNSEAILATNRTDSNKFLRNSKFYHKFYRQRAPRGIPRQSEVSELTYNFAVAGNYHGWIQESRDESLFKVLFYLIILVLLTQIICRESIWRAKIQT